MNSKLVSALAVVCAMLILIISGEWIYAKYAQNAAFNVVELKNTVTAPPEMPSINLARQSEESYVALVARPLFIKGRRPVDEPTSEQKNATGAFDWELSGVYSTKNGFSALFSRSKVKIPKDNFRKIAVGDNLDGWKLAEVQNDRVILSDDNSEKELLLRKPKAKELPQAKAKLKPPLPQSVPNPTPQHSLPVPPEVEPEIEPTEEDSLENGADE